MYAAAWTAATDIQKAAALAMATRLIDIEYQFGGRRVLVNQALQWPRSDCREPDGSTAEFVLPGFTPHFVVITTTSEQIAILNNTMTVPADLVPKAVVEATCELARELLIVDRTAAPPGEGLSYQNIGSNQTGYNKADTRPIIPAVVQALLAKYGALIKAKSGSVKLVRT